MAFDKPRHGFPSRQSHGGVLRLALNNEIAVTFQQLARMRRDGSEEADPHSAVALCLLSPLTFVSDVHEGRQDEGEIPLDVFAVRVDDLVTVCFEYGGEICSMDAGYVLE